MKIRETFRNLLVVGVSVATLAAPTMAHADDFESVREAEAAVETGKNMQMGSWILGTAAFLSTLVIPVAAEGLAIGATAAVAGVFVAAAPVVLTTFVVAGGLTLGAYWLWEKGLEKRQNAEAWLGERGANMPRNQPSLGEMCRACASGASGAGMAR